MPSFLSSGPMGMTAARSNCCCDDSSIDRNSAIFFHNLANKLLEMSQSFEDRIEKIKKDCGNRQANGFLFASIDTPSMQISVGAEYILYVQRYGPPPKGKFCPEKLKLLRQELGIEPPCV